MRVLSLFSGGGLGDYGLTLAGMEIVGQVEIDEYCQKILTLRWPEVPKWRDIREVKGEEVNQVCGRIDLVSGGFPCQDISTAGKGAGIGGERSGLWKEMFRIIREVRPRYVLVENVSALLGRGLGVVLGDLAEIGYDCEWDCIPASAIGAPHQRDRVWIVAYTRGGRFRKQNGGNEQSRGTEVVVSGKIISNWQAEIRSNVADSKSNGMERRSTKSCKQSEGEALRGSIGCGEDVCDTASERLPYRSEKTIFGSSQNKKLERPNWWAAKSSMGRSPDGPPLWLVRRHIGKGVSIAEQKIAIENLPKLWNDLVSETLWETIGGLDRFQKAEVLFAVMREYEKDADKTRLLLESEEALEAFVRGLWHNQKTPSSSRRPKQGKQQPEKHPNALRPLPQFLAHHLPQDWSEPGWEDEVPRVAHGITKRVDRLKLLGNGQVVQVVQWIGEQIMTFDRASHPKDGEGV